jgi:predicted type IV restriction endonuclease
MQSSVSHDTMTAIPKRVEDRLSASVKRFQSVLSSAKARDVHESDTVIIVTDMISEVFGYNKYSEISSEVAIRGMFCDLGIKIGDKIQFLVEVKAIGLELRNNHVVQAVAYAATHGVEWVVLTNGTNWRIYKVSFGKPVDQELVVEINFLTLNIKKDDVAPLYLLCREGWEKQVVTEFAAQRQALSRFFVASIALSAPVLDTIRRELKRACPDVKVKNEQIQAVLESEVFKREVLEGEKADEARKKISRSSARSLRNRESDNDTQVLPQPSSPPIMPPPSADPGLEPAQTA